METQLNAVNYVISPEKKNKIIMSKTHELKCVKEPFQVKWAGNKDWEFRKNDRDYKVGDVLLEKEYDAENSTYSGERYIETRRID